MTDLPYAILSSVRGRTAGRRCRYRCGMDSCRAEGSSLPRTDGALIALHDGCSERVLLLVTSIVNEPLIVGL